ncbi:MAG TPA: calcium/sodium antiporter [Acidimicrobiia bacterium]|nr:calcium/sodium antiporter [Acidimicrobiia bacterium]
MITDVLALVGGLACAAIGGEFFVRGAVGLAAWARVPARVVATTVAAFATSSPEFAVSTSAAIAGKPAIGLGDALGSNVTNIGLVLGVALLLLDLGVDRNESRLDVTVASIAPVLTLVLALDGTVSRVDGAILLVAFASWIGQTVRAARRERQGSARAAAAAARLSPRPWVFALVGLVALVVAGRLVADGARAAGNALGLDGFVVGATLVAIGTSLPELATTLSATRHGHHGVGLGTILGSNIFNGLWIVGVAACIAPITVRSSEVAVGLGFGVALVAALFPGRRQRLRRRRGFVLLGMYAAYVATLVLLGP